MLETQDGPALFDCGPTTCIPHLKAGLAERGLDLTDIRHLLLSHIHLDHAGAAGVLVRQHPWLQVHVSEVGAPHLVDPSKLEASARRLYGPSFDSLWGELAPVPERNVHVVGDRILGLECFPTPGHAWHHVSYLDADGTLYAGDAAGVRIAPGSFVLPPCPPPEIDLEAWEQTIDEIERRAPGRLALDPLRDVRRRAGAPRRASRDPATRGRAGSRTAWTRQTFVAAARYDAGRWSPSSPTCTTRPRRSGTTTAASSATGGRSGKRRAPSRRWLSLAHSVRLEVAHRDELECGGMRRLEHDRRRDAGLERLVPALRDDAPAVSRLEPREHPLRLWRDEVVPARYRELEELLGHDRADHVESRIAARAAVPVAVEPRHRIEGAGLEVAAEDVHAQA